MDPGQIFQTMAPGGIFQTMAPHGSSQTLAPDGIVLGLELFSAFALALSQLQLCFAESKDSLGGWICDLDTKATAGTGLPKEDSLFPDLQLCSVLLSSVLFQIQPFPNARVFGEVGTTLSLWLPMVARSQGWGKHH